MLDVLAKDLANTCSIDDKILLLNSFPSVEEFFFKYPTFKSFLFAKEELLVFQQLIAIGQAIRILPDINQINFEREAFHVLLAKLIPIDYFYREIGGIVGYQSKILALLKKEEKPLDPNTGYHSPAFFDIEKESLFVKEAVDWGIEAMPQIGEIYPLGGAADRLHLIEENTQVELPAAKLKFAGKTLLEHLIRDLQAREYLYFQKHKIRLMTPIAIMTSHEKNNHAHVVQICEELKFFGRPKNSIRFFSQPLVPTVNQQGDWCLAGPLKPILKPGGHGAIWKLARDEGIFEWFEGQGRQKGLVRQINNPIAGLDYGLLAFSGIGCKNQMIFGFASCPRLLQSAEGVNVLIERKDEVVLTNIEYCDFAKFGIEDLPLKEGEPYSRFSSNTNILFADLKAISFAVDRCPFPGLLINLKQGTYTTDLGVKKEETMARLESTMQNIADVFVEPKKVSLKTEKTFVTYNQRHKTISTAKKVFVPGKSTLETPENCFYDLMGAHRELLELSGFELPPRHSIETYLEKGPECLFIYHPALGPLYSTIQKKICGGSLGLGSEWILELSDFFAQNLKIEGSLRIIAEQPVGHIDQAGILQYSEQIGSCVLENVVIENKGVKWGFSKPFWRLDLKREESTTIILKGKSKFIARNVHLKGNHTYIVEEGQTLQV